LIARAHALAISARLSPVGEAIEVTFEAGHAPLQLVRRERHWAVELPVGWVAVSGFAPKLAVAKRLEWEGKWPERAGESVDERAARIAAAMAHRAEWSVVLVAPHYFVELPDLLTDDAAVVAAGEFAMMLDAEAHGPDRAPLEEAL